MARKKVSESIEIPEGITCNYDSPSLVCKSSSAEISKVLDIPGVDISVSDKEVIISCNSASRKEYSFVKTVVAHVKNIFHGLEKEYVYELESASVHFPMTIKAESDNLIINNFLGEKVPRKAKILPNVKVEVKGQSITVSSPDRDAAGQTAANFENATKVGNRDRRIFQDGIFIKAKPSRIIEEDLEVEDE